MSELLEYGAVRERFFKLVNERPGDFDLIAHNCAAVLSKGTAWPPGFTQEQIGIAVSGCMRELFIRWEFASGLRGAGGRKEKVV